MKEYGQVPEAVELVEDRKARGEAVGCGPQQPPVEQPQPRCRRSAKRVLEGYG